MADLDIPYAEQDTDQTTTNTGPTNSNCTISSGTFTGSKTYLIAATGLLSNGSASTNREARLRYSIGFVFPGSSGRYENQSNRFDNYGWVGELSQPATPYEVALQFWNTSSNTATFRNQVITCLNLTDDWGGNYASGTDNDTASPVANTTTWANRASTGSFSVTSGDLILVLGCVSWDVNNLAIRGEARIYLDSTTALATISEEGENVNERRVHNIAAVFTATGSSHTFDIQVQDSASGTQNDHVYSYIIALNLTNVPADANILRNAAEYTPYSALNTWDEILGGSPPNLSLSADGAVMAFAFGAAVNDAVVDQSRMRLQIDGTSYPNSTDPAAAMVHAWDALDLNPMFVMAKTGSLTAGTLDVDVDAYVEDTTAQGVQDRSVAAFSVAKAGAANKRRYTLPTLGVG